MADPSLCDKGPTSMIVSLCRCAILGRQEASAYTRFETTIEKAAVVNSDDRFDRTFIRDKIGGTGKTIMSFRDDSNHLVSNFAH